jgi:chaperonin GroEL (HSP60 family)
MAIDFREKFLDNLTESACEIIKKQASGICISDNEYLFVQMYLDELEKYERIPLSRKIINGVKEISSFVKENMGGMGKLFENSNDASNGIADDYVINTNVDEVSLNEFNN